MTLSHTAAGGDYGSVSQELVVTVTDDDTASLVVSPETVTVAEAGSATYTVKLATEPTEDGDGDGAGHGQWRQRRYRWWDGRADDPQLHHQQLADGADGDGACRR